MFFRSAFTLSILYLLLFPQAVSSIGYTIISATDQRVEVRFTLSAADSAHPPPEGWFFCAFTSAPGLTPTINAAMTPPGAGVVAVAQKAAGWAGRQYLQWIAFRPYRLRSGRYEPLGGSGTLMIDFGVSAIAAAPRSGDPVPHSIVSLAMRSGLAKCAGASFPAPPYSFGVKMDVDKDGIYAVSGAALKAKGVPIARIPSRQFRLFERDREIPIYITNPHRSTMADDDLLMFYGKALRGTNSHLSQFSATNVYWLSWNTGRSGVRIAEASGALRIDAGQYRPDDAGDIHAREFRDTIHLETDAAIRWLGRISEPQELTDDPAAEQFIDNWYWGRIGEKELTHFDLAVCSPSSKGMARLRMELFGISMADAPHDHALEILLNNSALIDGAPQRAVWDGQNDLVFVTGWFPVSRLKHGVNVLTFVRQTRGFADLSGLNWIEIDYPRTFVALDNAIVFKNNPLDANRIKQFTIEGFTTPDVDLWDISRNRLFTGFKAQQVTTRSRTTYSIIFQDSLQEVTTWCAQATSARRTPIMSLDTINASWEFPNGLDYVMVTAPHLMSALTPLAAYYRALGWKAAVMNINDIYNRFSFGIRDPEAIRTMLRHLFATCGDRPPRYLLLGGDASHDLDKTGNQANIVPTHLSRIPRWGPASDDGYFAAVAGDDNLPDLFVGRFPAVTADQMERMVAKTLRYLQHPSFDSWRNTLLLIGGYDKSSAFDDFGNLAESDIIGPRMHILRLDADPQSPYYVGEFSAAQRVADAINAGVYAVNFAGHGGGNVWSDSRFFSFTDLNKLHNDQWARGGRLPVVFSFTCLTGFFESNEYASLGEEFLRSGPGGCIGFYGASAYTSREGNLIMNGVLLHDAVSGVFESLGEMLWLCEMKMLVMDEQKWLPLVRQYTLLGDPAIPWALAPDSLRLSLNQSVARAGDSLIVQGSCAPVTRGSVRVRISGDGRTLGDYSLPADNAAFRLALPLKESATISRGIVHAYAWNESASLRGWALFSKNRLWVSDVHTMPEHPQWGDTVRIACRILLPESVSISAVRCLYTIESPTAASTNPAFSSEIGLQPDSQGWWQSESTIPLVYPGIAGKALLVKFRIAGPNAESEIHVLPIRGLPDLRFGGSAPRIGWNGDSLCAAFEVINAGDAAALPFTVAIELNAGTGFAFAAQAQRADSLPPGAVQRFATAFADTQGSLAIRIILNPDSSFDELSYANNAGMARAVVRFSDLQESGDTLRSAGGGICITPASQLARPARCFLFAESLQTAVLPSAHSRWLPLRAEPAHQFTIYRRPPPADSAEALQWIFLPDTTAAGLPKPAAASGAKAAILVYDSAIARWRYTPSHTPGQERSITTVTARPGPFAAAILGDVDPPRIAVSVAGHRILSLDYAAKNNPFDIFITDPSGMAADAIEVRLNQRVMAGRAISEVSFSDNRQVARLTAYPPKENYIDSLIVSAADLAGNDTTIAFAYLPGEALAVKFLACHPNPFTARQDAGGTVLRPIKLAYLLTDVADHVSMTIYTLTGITVASWEFYDQIGYQEVVWDGMTQRGNRLANGTYYVKLIAKNKRITAKKFLKIAKLEGYERR